MLLSLVKDLLSDTVSIETFREEIAPEIDGYKKLYDKKNVTIPIHLKEDIYYLFTQADFDALQTFFTRKTLTACEISYICDALILSEMTTFENDGLPDQIESLVNANY